MYIMYIHTVMYVHSCKDHSCQTILDIKTNGHNLIVPLQNVYHYV